MDNSVAHKPNYHGGKCGLLGLIARLFTDTFLTSSVKKHWEWKIIVMSEWVGIWKETPLAKRWYEN